MSAPEGQRTPVSVVILTKDEERYIKRCVDSAWWADEVLVLDSGSEDATRETAAESGAKVYEQSWLGWSAQRNRAVELATNDWVFPLDADEVVSPELARSIIEVTSGPMDPRDGYSPDRRADFLGALLPNPARRSKRRGFIRLFNRRHGAWDPTQLVHEEVRVPGRSLPLRGPLLHWRGMDVDQLVSTFNRYATPEAEVLAAAGVRPSAAKLVYRPLLRFAWSYLYKGGWRLGTRGLMWALLKAVSEYVRYAKLWEREHAESRIHPPSEWLTAPPEAPVSARAGDSGGRP
jgi:(heptosyl)LPS beta-1,4-glucosyltransferase